MIGETGVPPYNRTLVDKGLMTGLLTAEQVALPAVEGTQQLLDTVLGLDVARSAALLASVTEIQSSPVGRRGSATASVDLLP